MPGVWHSGRMKPEPFLSNGHTLSRIPREVHRAHAAARAAGTSRRVTTHYNRRRPASSLLRDRT